MTKTIRINNLELCVGSELIEFRLIKSPDGCAEGDELILDFANGQEISVYETDECVVVEGD